MPYYRQTLLQQLGIVSGICNEIKLTEVIDNLIPKPKRKVSVGKAVQAMILNALGFTGRAMYLTPEFYKNRPVEILIDPEIKAEDLHDDCLGTALDVLYEYGVTELFYQVASTALSTYKIQHRFVHLDTSSFSLHGKYNSEDEECAEEVVTITKGYSKDNNPDLNQVIVSLMCAYRSSIPVWIEVLSGNSPDKKSLKESIKKYKEQFNKKKLPYFVADSALYSEDNLKQLSHIRWVTRVPETLKEARTAGKNANKAYFTTSSQEGYSYQEMRSTYAGIDQRWLLVFSQKAYDREVATLKKNIKKKRDEKEKELWHLSNQPFACEADSLDALKRFKSKLKYHNFDGGVESKRVYDKKGRPGKDSEPSGMRWFIKGIMKDNEKAISEAMNKKGLFIIATNELNDKSLTNEMLLSVYKAQGISVERGFRFLKDPMFFAHSLYLNSPRRIMALIMVMGLSLLVYSLAERKLRKVMADNGETIPNQVGKPTSTPTIRRIFQMFEDILFLSIYGRDSVEHMVMNMESVHKKIIHLLGHHVEKMYFL
jgi:transposase